MIFPVTIPSSAAPRKYTRYCCYARLIDNGNSIRSDSITIDGSEYYADLGVGGNDKIQVETYDDNGELRFLRVFIGKMELPYRSHRWATLWFDLEEDADKPVPGAGMAVYESLIRLSEGGFAE